MTSLTFFPIDGLFTRTIEVPPPKGIAFPLKYVETSSPGLRGQSGGPTFCSKGAIWAIQSQTRHLPLGFSPEIKDANKTHKEHQFLNVGMGIHTETVLGLFNQLAISHQVSIF
jgi:FtsP/CotA-like multicopper oxidase with cupredoxin domain